MAVDERYCFDSSYEMFLIMDMVSHTVKQSSNVAKFLLSSLWNLCFGNESSVSTILFCDSSQRHSQRIRKVVSLPTTRKWTHIQGLSHHLVTSCGGPAKQLLFWRQNCTSWTTTDKLGDSWDYPSYMCSGSINMEVQQSSILITGTRERTICLWSDSEQILYEEKSAHDDSIVALCSWSSFVASSDFSGTVKIWRMYKVGNEIKLSLETSKQVGTTVDSILAIEDGDNHKLVFAGTEIVMWDSGLQHSRVLEGRSLLYTCLCRFQNWIVAGTFEGFIYLWNLNGILEKKLDAGENIVSLQSWGKFLCVGFQSKISLWEPAGNTVMSLDGTHCMTVYQDKLVTCTDNEVILYEPHMDWKTQKLLWVGNLKETSEECSLAILPPELLYKVLSYL